MTTRIRISTIAVGLLFILPHAAAAQDLATQLTGVWKRTSLIVKQLDTGATTPLFGERPDSRRPRCQEGDRGDPHRLCERR
jgi:hypothetical protein